MTRASEASATHFANRVRGLDPQPIDLVFARLNHDVYKDHASRVDNWRPVPIEELAAHGIRPSDLENRHTGFRARFYADEDGNYALVFCGTNQGKDWKHNFGQGAGLEDRQYEKAIDLSRKAHRAFGPNLVLTGHSLGGGLASAGALATNAPAVTFNSSGLHDNTIERLNLEPAATRRLLASNGQIRRYAVDNEILTDLQEHRLLTRHLLPDAIGHRIDLPDPDPMPRWQRLIPGASLKHGVDVHGMDAVLRAQAMAQPSLADAAHPGHALYRQSLDGLRKVDPAPTGLQSDRDYRNAAAALAVEAASTGLQRIDHVVPSREGTRAFAVEGRLDDAAHRVAGIDIRESTQQPMEASTARFPAVAPEPTVPDLTRRPALSY